ncbi:hypothetical protein ACROYT_G016728 [Oculina patagonica]
MTHQKLALKIMNMTRLYLFLSLLALQLFLATPSVIREEQVENRDEPRSSEANKTELESTDRDIPLFLRPSKQDIMKERQCHGKSPGDAQAEDRDTAAEKAELEVDACRKVDMFVNFADIGLYDTIIAPPGFKAYQCKGKCSPTNHSLLKALIEKKNGIKTNDEACCVPTKLKPLFVLFMGENNKVVLRMVNDMIVEECGCY